MEETLFSNTGCSFSEALILASIKQKYDDSILGNLPEKNMFCSEILARSSSFALSCFDFL